MQNEELIKFQLTAIEDCKRSAYMATGRMT